MQRRTYTASELARFGAIVGEPAALVAHVSNGPWYGFNGVQALVLTDSALYRIQQGFALLPERILASHPVGDVRQPRWTTGRTGRAGRISFSVAGARHAYASKWQEAADLATALQTIVPSG